MSLFPQSQIKFFEDLEPVEGAIEAYNTLKEVYDVRILTCPSVYNPLSYTEKRLWVEKHLGFEECYNLILCRDKTSVRGDYLIDDFPQPGSFEPEWHQLFFGSSEFPHWGAITDYLLK